MPKAKQASKRKPVKKSLKSTDSKEPAAKDCDSSNSQMSDESSEPGSDDVTVKSVKSKAKRVINIKPESSETDESSKEVTPYKKIKSINNLVVHAKMPKQPIKTEAKLALKNRKSESSETEESSEDKSESSETEETSEDKSESSETEEMSSEEVTPSRNIKSNLVVPAKRSKNNYPNLAVISSSDTSYSYSDSKSTQVKKQDKSKKKPRKNVNMKEEEGKSKTKDTTKKSDEACLTQVVVNQETVDADIKVHFEKHRDLLLENVEDGYQTIKLKKSCLEYKDIAKKMLSTVCDHNNKISFSSYEILKIHAVVNKEVDLKYQMKKNRLQDEMGEEPLEKILLHGSKFSWNITIEGFRVSEAKTDNMFGSGMYFADISSKANQYCFGVKVVGNKTITQGCDEHGDLSCYVCPRLMLVCLVNLGKTFVATTADRKGSLPEGYHSVSAMPSTVLRYPEYIVYSNDQVYPMYLVEFKLVPPLPVLRSATLKHLKLTTNEPSLKLKELLAEGLKVVKHMKSQQSEKSWQTTYKVLMTFGRAKKPSTSAASSTAVSVATTSQPAAASSEAVNEVQALPVDAAQLQTLRDLMLEIQKMESQKYQNYTCAVCKFTLSTGWLMFVHLAYYHANVTLAQLTSSLLV